MMFKDKNRLKKWLSKIIEMDTGSHRSLDSPSNGFSSCLRWRMHTFWQVEIKRLGSVLLVKAGSPAVRISRSRQWNRDQSGWRIGQAQRCGSRTALGKAGGSSTTCTAPNSHRRCVLRATRTTDRHLTTILKPRSPQFVSSIPRPFLNSDTVTSRQHHPEPCRCLIPDA
jgi:hypothetical protein